MKSKGAFTPHGTPDGDSMSKMSLCIDNRSGSILDSLDSECANSNDIINGNVNNFNSNNIIKQYNSKNINKYKMSQHYYFISFVVSILFVLILTPNSFVVLADDASGSGYAEVTTEFNPEGRGNRKFSDKCETTNDCGFAGSICSTAKTCLCAEHLSATNHIDKCGRPASVNETCTFNEQCEAKTPETECRDNRCICRFDKIPMTKKDGNIECTAVKHEPVEPIRTVDPAMIGVLVGMALMFVIICVVLRLFSQARWRENRTIFNTPNPRLMNVSLLRDNKLLHGGERRGSRMSVRVPSRQPSMTSLRPHSPNASIGSRRGSSNISGSSIRSNRSLHHQLNNHRDSTATNGHSNHTTSLAHNHPQHLNLQHEEQPHHGHHGHHLQQPHHGHRRESTVSQHHHHRRESRPRLENVKVEITEVKP